MEEAITTRVLMREAKWTEAVAVGGAAFLTDIKGWIRNHQSDGDCGGAQHLADARGVRARIWPAFSYLFEGEARRARACFQQAHKASKEFVTCT